MAKRINLYKIFYYSHSCIIASLGKRIEKHDHVKTARGKKRNVDFRIFPRILTLDNLGVHCAVIINAIRNLKKPKAYGYGLYSWDVHLVFPSLFLKWVI